MEREILHAMKRDEKEGIVSPLSRKLSVPCPQYFVDGWSSMPLRLDYAQFASSNMPLPDDPHVYFSQAMKRKFLWRKHRTRGCLQPPSAKPSTRSSSDCRSSTRAAISARCSTLTERCSARSHLLDDGAAVSVHRAFISEWVEKRGHARRAWRKAVGRRSSSTMRCSCTPHS